MLIRFVIINRCIVTSLKRVKAAWLSLGTRLPAMWCDRIFDNFVVFIFFPLRTMHWKLIITTGDALAPRDEALLCKTWHRATGCRGDRTHQVGGRYWWWQDCLWRVWGIILYLPLKIPRKLSTIKKELISLKSFGMDLASQRYALQAVFAIIIFSCHEHLYVPFTAFVRLDKITK